MCSSKAIVMSRLAGRDYSYVSDASETVSEPYQAASSA